MARDLTPDEVGELLGAYALGAVSDEERRLVEEHVAREPSAAAELGALQDAAVWLAVSETPASPELWAKIAARTAPTPRPLRIPPVPTRRGPSARVIAAAAVAAVVLIGVVVGAFAFGSDGDGVSPPDLAAAALRALFSSAARRVHLGAASGRAAAEIVLLADGAGYIVSADLPRLPSGRTYQLWALTGPTKVSLGVLGRQLRPSAFRMAGNPNVLAITDEVAGGVGQPANAPVVAGDVPRRA
jgi:anti-sigma-K factor RskA